MQFPRSEQFTVHKLIVADRRRGGQDHVKSRKDRAQAAFLIEVLATDRPDNLAEAYEDALSQGPCV
ncbi:GSU2403 family nucleotidyltransferase fold protein [Celeribacter naphthalenivorans]|uniref:GSU2403 family nucleotidyltransferase fold protein n=1 Tax=Celeribacter naphthalenivorans TaxID=1614694 RepID=UPI001CFAEF69|nr:GSU2403 family nucleotidyltransferase fold protein [Celeribacter naphthalenivorans]